MKIIIVGGIDGGAACATRLRKLDEKAEILLLERRPYISYPNSGLPYHIEGITENESSPIFAKELTFNNMFAIDCRPNCEVIGISTRNKTIQIQNLKTDEITVEKYDKLVISPSAEPVFPNLPGIELPGVFSIGTVPDAMIIMEWLNRGNSDKGGLNSYTLFRTVPRPKRAVVVGGGFVGLEMAENLVHLNLEVTLIERQDQLMSQFDPKMAHLVEKNLVKHGIRVELNDSVTVFEKTRDGCLSVNTASGKKHPADIVILAMGVRPETNLAKMAGIEIGQHGGIRVNEHMQTSHPDIYAVGDAVEVRDFVSGQWTFTPLAGPAKRQGHIAADAIAGRNSRYRGTQGTSIGKIFETTVAQTGTSEKALESIGDMDFEKIYIYPDSHTGYYPDAKILAIKILFRKSNGLLLGAQILGEEGVTKRIDVFSMAIQMGCTIYDLEEAELSNAVSYGSSKDPLNFNGFAAAADLLLQNEFKDRNISGGIFSSPLQANYKY
jgi:NADPH-dependent 2,4-dienoyl-CoA reductase/sulfur reductase-like enzyme